MLKNQDSFEEVYPDSDDDKSEVEDDEDGPKPRKDFDDEFTSYTKKALVEVRQKIKALEDDVKRAAELVSSAESRLKMLDEYANEFEPKSGGDMSDIVQAYHNQRQIIFQDHMDGTIRQRELNHQIRNQQTTERKLNAQVLKEMQTAQKARAKEQKPRLKELVLKKRRSEKRYAEKLRVQKERKKFWARSCYVVRITLDGTQYTPISSRRSSISSVTDLVKPSMEKQDGSSEHEADSGTCDLTITYVTSAASWSASYDLQLNTTSNTGTLFFDAQLTNNTSESWKDCRISLSTSQAVFAGLQDTIPKLVPWRIAMAGKVVSTSGDIASSTQEALEQNKWKNALKAGSRANAGTDLLGYISWLDPPHQGALFSKPSQNNVFSPSQGSPFGGPSRNTVPSQPQGSPFSVTSQDTIPPKPQGSLFGVASQHNATSQPQASLFGGPSRNKMLPPQAQNIGGGGLFGSAAAAAPNNEVKTSLDVDEPTAPVLPEFKPELPFQKSAEEETGLTTTYDLPGTKSLVPSSTASKQRVAQIAFTDVVFSHTIVAKYRPAAFLKAQLLNASRISLLEGPIGLTLDGAFMGRSTLPHCSSGQPFTMSLGVDPAIKVVYPKPDVRRITSGMFTKDKNTIYTRSITIDNTRGSSSSAGGKALRLLVLDQVPVSQDDKLRIEILQPSGLVEDGAGVSTGVQDGTAEDGKDWGKAVATLKKGGEVNWDVELNAGESVKLGLEYGVCLPAGDCAVQANSGEYHGSH